MTIERTDSYFGGWVNRTRIIEPGTIEEIKDEAAMPGERVIIAEDPDRIKYVTPHFQKEFRGAEINGALAQLTIHRQVPTLVDSLIGHEVRYRWIPKATQNSENQIYPLPAQKQ